jgi:outer membrane protein OmpA-like peptidoglycan-associated protein
MLFMLFVTTLLGAGVITTWAVRSEERLKGCGVAEKLMESFQACVGAERVSESAACKVPIGEDRLRFEEGKAQLTGASQQYARQVATCLVDVVDTALADPAISERLDVVTIDGFTDCRGDQADNLQLGAVRGAHLFRYVIDAAKAKGWDAGRQADVFGRIAIRSFGKNRPTRHSPCASGPEKGMFTSFDADRRVEISFQSRLLED